MADDDTQGSIDTPRGASDASPDPQLPSMGFDEPIAWPESPVWDDIAGPLATDPAAGAEGDLFFPPAADLPPMAEVEAALAAEVEAAHPPDPDARWRPVGDRVPDDEVDAEATMQHAGPLAALGGGSGPGPSDSGGNVPWPAGVHEPPRPEGPVEELPVLEPELGSIWSNERRDDPHDLVGLGGVAAPAIYADADRTTRDRWRRFDVRPGNAAVIGLISVVSLVLLGMFLSVRARNDVPTDSSQRRPVANDITVAGPLNTIPPTSLTTTTTAPPAVINLSELLQATETTTETTTATTSAGSGASAATTTPTARSAAPTSASATTTPTTEATVTTEAPSAPAEVTSPPATDTTPTTSRPPTSITIPTWTIPTSPSSPSFSIPENFTRLPGFSSGRDD